MFSPNYLSRREMLAQAGTGFGAIALSSLLASDSRAESTRPPHMAPKAKSVIFLFMEGGPSHLDTFDPKPELEKYAGQPLPSSFKPVILAMCEKNPPLLASKRKWAQHGEGGLWVSDWLPHMATCADDLCVVRSLYSDGLNHSGGVTQMNTGSILSGRPSLGAWVNYGLGSGNKNLPSFVVLLDDRDPIGGAKQWTAGFLPATYQGTQFRTGDTPLLNLKPPEGTTDVQQRGKLALLKK